MVDPISLGTLFGGLGGAAGAGGLGTLGTLATTGLALSSAFKGGKTPAPPAVSTPPVPPSLYQSNAASNYASTAAKAAASQNATIGTSTQGDQSAATTAKPGLKTLLGQ